jgi:hypothetical protein
MTQVRQHWTEEDVWTLKSMATKYPRAEIASEQRRKESAVQAKPWELGSRGGSIGASERQIPQPPMTARSSPVMSEGWS